MRKGGLENRERERERGLCAVVSDRRARGRTGRSDRASR